MADKKKYKPSANFVDFSSAAEVSAPAAPAPALDPKEFEKVPRPDVPKTEEAVPLPALTGTVGAVANLADNLFPDDLGGMLRGSSGWLDKVPGYEQTVGKAADVALTGGGAVVDAMNWGSEQMNHLGAALMSWMPGGVQTLDWEQSQNISLGQVMMANAGINWRKASDGDIGAALMTPWAGPVALISLIADPNQPVATDENFQILNPEDRKKAFVDNVNGALGSGIMDGVWNVVADPTIAGGKASAVLRTGTKMGRFGGYSNQALRTYEQAARFGRSLDRGLEHAATGGASGRWTPEIEHVQDLISRPASMLDTNIFVKNSTDPALLKRLASQVNPEDLETGVALVKASAGLADGWKALRARDVVLYDQFATGMGVDPLATLPGRVDLSADQVAYAKSYLERVNKAVDEADAARLRSATEAAASKVGDNAAEETLTEMIPAGQLITRGGNRVSASMARMADSYRVGAVTRQFGTPDVMGLRSIENGPVFAKSQWVSDVLEIASGSRPVEIVRWLGKGSPSGIVSLKNVDDQEIRAWLQKSSLTPEQRAGYYDDFISAATVDERRNIILSMERAETAAIAAKRGVSPKVAQQMYDSYVKSRNRHLATLRDAKDGFAVDPDTGKLLKVPQFYTDLDQSFPMLNQAVIKRVVHRNHKWLSHTEDLTVALDTINTWWKLSVLLRLGYTQRNITEGLLRSVATLGLIATNPEAFASLPQNMIAFTQAKRLQRNASTLNTLLMHSQENILQARTALLETRKAARVDDMFAARDAMTSLDAPIKKLQDLAAPTKRQAKELDRLLKKRETARLKYEKLKTESVDPAVPDMTYLSKQEQDAIRQADDLASQVQQAMDELRKANARRKRGGRSANVMDDGTELTGAFQGPEGRIAELLSSADRTVYQTIDTGYEARRAVTDAQQRMSILDPRKLAADNKLSYYFDEYATRLNQRWANDPLVKMWLAEDASTTGRFSGDLMNRSKAFLMSESGRYYRENMSIHGRKLQNGLGAPREAAIEEYLTELWRQYNDEIPKDTNLRQLLREGTVTPGDVSAALRGRELPAIVGHALRGEAVPNAFVAAHEKATAATGVIMRWLGSIPETKLLRHPFYNQVYKQRQRDLYALAREQGTDVESVTAKARINRAAHKDALQATKDTMYTIERLSNAATMLRWISPFFPAFENSIRVWGRIVYQNPSVLGWGNILWNIPNEMGMVYNPKTGEQVDRSNFMRDDGYVIVMPKLVTDVLKERIPGFPDDQLKWRQQGFNVVNPNALIWWPGIGAFDQTAVALFLRGKPELTDVLRTTMSPEMFNSIVPYGDPNTDLVNVMLSTTAKRIKGLMNDKEDDAYLSLQQTMVEDAYIRNQLLDKPTTKADIRKALDKADEVWKFQIRSAGMDFTPASTLSEFAPQRAYWLQLLDDQSLSWNEKTQALIDKFPDLGDAVLAVTRSGTTTKTGLQPTLATWQKIQRDPELVAELNNTDPELVGMFGNMGNFDDPFSYSVLGEMKNMEIGSDGKPIKFKTDPDLLIRKNQITDGWREFKAVEAMVNEKAQAAGFSNINEAGAEQFLAVLGRAEMRLKVQYPAWGEEKTAYATKTPLFISGARKIIERGALVGEDTTISALREYIQIRDMIAEQKAATDDPAKKKELNQVGYRAAGRLRQMDIGFADMYDRYFADDDFRVV